MSRAHLVALLRRHLLEERLIPPEGLARMTDGDVIVSCFTCSAFGVTLPSAEQLDKLVASSETLAAFLAVADIWRELNQPVHRAPIVEATQGPWNLTYDPGRGPRTDPS